MRPARRSAVAASAAVTLALTAVSLAGPLASAGALSAGDGGVDVVVRVSPGALPAVQAAVTALGGVVAGELPLVGGFAATVPSASAAVVRTLPGVVTATEDHAVHLESAAAPSSARDAVAGKGPLPTNTYLTRPAQMRCGHRDLRVLASPWPCSTAASRRSRSWPGASTTAPTCRARGRWWTPLAMAPPWPA